MAISKEITVLSQSSIYKKVKDSTNENRKLKVYYSIPKKGVNTETGILLFIAGFGGRATSNVYRKMRDNFSDKYNLITVQCDYFGYEFMQSASKIIKPEIDKNELKGVFSSEEIEKIYNGEELNFDEFLEFGSKKRKKIIAEVKASLDENEDNFVDMGMLQAIDNITAVLNIIKLLNENNYSVNTKKIIIYGHSHGAYLSYLCNRYCASLFSLIIDNSAWLSPVYLENNRYLNSSVGNLTLCTVFEYRAKDLIEDKDALNLNILYSKFKNNCFIITYQGTTDKLVNHKEKERFCKGIDNCIYNEISREKIDNEVFKSTNHGLDSDFIKMFDYTMSNFNMEFKKDRKIKVCEEVKFETNNYVYVIKYNDDNPKIKVLKKK